MGAMYQAVGPPDEPPLPRETVRPAAMPYADAPRPRFREPTPHGSRRVLNFGPSSPGTDVMDEDSPDQPAESRATPGPASQVSESLSVTPWDDAPEDPAMMKNFMSRLQILRSIYPEDISCPTPTKQPTGMGRLPPEETPRPPSAAFRRSALAEGYVDMHQRQLAGEDDRRRRGDAGPLPPGSFLPRCPFSHTTYQIAGEPTKPVAVPIPAEFRKLQPQAAPKPAVTLTDADSQDMELLFRHLERSCNFMDWFLGGVSNLVSKAETECTAMAAATAALLEQVRQQCETQDVHVELPQLPEAPTSLLHSARSLLDSASRGEETVMQLTLHGLHNWILRRRDAQLDKCHKTVDKAMRTTLRNHDFRSQCLFDADTARDVAQRHSQESKETATIKVMEQVAKQRAAPAASSSTAGSSFRKESKPSHSQSGFKTQAPKKQFQGASKPDTSTSRDRGSSGGGRGRGGGPKGHRGGR